MAEDNVNSDESGDDLDLDDPSVPTDLLDLYVQLEDEGLTPEEFRQVFADPKPAPDPVVAPDRSTTYIPERPEDPS